MERNEQNEALVYLMEESGRLFLAVKWFCWCHVYLDLYQHYYIEIVYITYKGYRVNIFFAILWNWLQ